MDFLKALPSLRDGVLPPVAKLNTVVAFSAENREFPQTPTREIFHSVALVVDLQITSAVTR